MEEVLGDGGARVGLDGGLAAFFSLVDFVGSGEVGEDGEIPFFCEGGNFFGFSGDVPAIEDEAAGFGVAAVFKVFDGGGDVVCGVEGHFFAARDDEDVFGVAFANGGSEASTDDVAEDVVEDDVGLVGFEEAEVFEDAERGDDAAPGATEAWSGAASFDAEDATKTLSCDGVEALWRIVVGAEVVHDGGERGAAEEILRGVGFGVAADLDDAFAEAGEGGGEVAGDGGFSDAAFAVDGDFLHGVPPGGGNFWKIVRSYYTWLGRKMQFGTRKDKKESARR